EPVVSSTFELVVTPDAVASATGLAGPILQLAHEALADAEGLKRLPDDYADVTLGMFARWKRWLKSKLLGNFKRGYVDVISRQQSQMNQRLVTAIQQLAECCATLDHALRTLQQGSGTHESKPSQREFADGTLHESVVSPARLD